MVQFGRSGSLEGGGAQAPEGGLASELPVVIRHGPVGLLHVDAHMDTADKALGEKLYHGTPFRRCVDEGLLDCKRVVQVGIRGSAMTLDPYRYSRSQVPNPAPLPLPQPARCISVGCPFGGGCGFHRGFNKRIQKTGAEGRVCLERVVWNREERGCEFMRQRGRLFAGVGREAGTHQPLRCHCRWLRTELRRPEPKAWGHLFTSCPHLHQAERLPGKHDRQDPSRKDPSPLPVE